jgi:hypothetical protein
MSKQQFYEMYREEGVDATEWCEETVKNVPIGELAMIVRLPLGFVMQDPKLFVSGLDREAQPDLQKAFEANLRYDPELNLITLYIQDPPQNMRYRLQWSLPDSPPPSSLPTRSLTGGAVDTVRRMLKFAATSKENPFNSISEEVLTLAVEEFKLNPGERKSLEFSIMAYDKSDRFLHIVAASLQPDDARWGLKVPYGDGIAGRVYKNNSARVFVKQEAIRNNTPFYCLGVDQTPVSDDGHEVKEEVIVSMPLHYHGNREHIFGVLNLSSKEAGSKLADLSEASMGSSGSFAQGVADACLRVLNDVHWHP